MMIPTPRTRAIILCAGDATRWSNYLGLPKQLISFNGESLLSRMVRLLRENGVEECVCVANDRRLRVTGAKPLLPSQSRYLVETIMSSVAEWSARTIILLGDVFFTEKAMRAIVSFSGDVGIFGRPWASKLVNCSHGELFGISFSHLVSDKIIETAEHVRELADAGARGNLWDLYHTLVDLPLNSGMAESKLFKVIDDLTNDFDRPEDYIRCGYRYRALTSSCRIPRIMVAVELAAIMPFHIFSRRSVAVGPRRLPSVR
ncbi:MAG: NTP transferase domain-containing protein [Sulfuricaulis sp.]